MHATFSIHGSGRRARSVELPIDEERSNLESGSSFDIYAYAVTEERLNNFRNDTNQTALHFSPSFKAVRLPYYVVFSCAEDDGEKYAYVRSEDCHPLWIEMESFFREERSSRISAVEESSTFFNRRFNNRSRFFFPSSRFARSPSITIISLPPSIPVPVQLLNARESDDVAVAAATTDGGEIEEEDDIPTEDLCKVCYARRKTHIAVPCGHFAFCRKCIIQLPYSCAVCRSACHLYCKVINVE